MEALPLLTRGTGFQGTSGSNGEGYLRAALALTPIAANPFSRQVQVPLFGLVRRTPSRFPSSPNH